MYYNIGKWVLTITDVKGTITRVNGCTLQGG